MKLVVKFKETLKLVSSQTTYQELLETIERQFHLCKGTIHVTYIDEEGDQITMGENEDLQTMKILHNQKEYVKIYVEGQALLNFSKQKNIFQESSIRFDDCSELPSQDPKVESQVNHQADCIDLNVKMETSVIEEAQKNQRLSTKQLVIAEQLPLFSTLERKETSVIGYIFQDRSLIRQASVKVIQNQKEKQNQEDLKETVAKLVDQRIRVLLPCLRELLSQREPGIYQEQKLIHYNIGCQGCFAHPIIGIRYQCISCPNFNLCERCQVKIYHKHNLLKVKQIVREQKDNSIDQGFNIQNSNDCSRLSGPCQKKKNQRYCWDLKRYNFNDVELDQSCHQDRQSRVSYIRQSQVKKEIPKAEEPIKNASQVKKQQKAIKKQEEEIVLFTYKNLDMLKKKQQILKNIKDIFPAGDLNMQQVIKTIETHFEKGQDHIINLIIDSQ